MSDATFSKTTLCKECSRSVSVNAEICPHCGVRLKAVPNGLGVALNGKSRIVAALLALLFGGFGIHRFYLGRVGSGILYLLFCWTFIPSFIALIEFVLLLVMSDEQFNEKYGQ